MFEQLFTSAPPDVKIIIILMFGGPFALLTYGFISLKIWMRVGEIEPFKFGFFYVIALGILFIIIVPTFLKWDPYITLVDSLGLTLGIPFGVLCYNKYPGDIRLVLFIAIDFDTIELDYHFSYVYTKNHVDYIIEFDPIEKEPVWAFIKRMFGIRTQLHWYTDPGMVFNEKRTPQVYFLDGIEDGIKDRIFYDSEYYEVPKKDERGFVMRDQEGAIIYEEKEKINKWLGLIPKKIRVTIVNPVKAQQYSKTEFLTRWRDYEDMNENLDRLYNAHMRLKARTRAVSYKMTDDRFKLYDEELFGIKKEEPTNGDAEQLEEAVEIVEEEEDE